MGGRVVERFRSESAGMGRRLQVVSFRLGVWWAVCSAGGCGAKGGGLCGLGWWMETLVVAKGGGDGGQGVSEGDGLIGGEVVEDEFVDVVGVLRGDGFQVFATDGSEFGVGDAAVVRADASFDVASGEEVVDAVGEAAG